MILWHSPDPLVAGSQHAPCRTSRWPSARLHQFLPGSEPRSEHWDCFPGPSQQGGANRTTKASQELSRESRAQMQWPVYEIACGSPLGSREQPTIIQPAILAMVTSASGFGVG